MARISISPLSVNKCWRGRRFKTPDYSSYEREVSYLLPKLKIPTGKLFVQLTFGFSSKRADLDNPVKPFLDILQKKYGFNDCQIYILDVAKEDVAKGREFVQFEISPI